MRLKTIAFAALSMVPALALAQLSAGVRVEVPEVRIEATTAPPPPRSEVQPPAPGPDFVWIAGHHRWEHGAYVWRPGHWDRPPGPGYVWEPAHWARRGGSWFFRDGHWKAVVAVAPAPPPVAVTVYTPPVAADVEVGQAPPAPVAEAQTAPPFAGAVWIPGYWSWNGAQYVWAPGLWSAPRPGHVWVSGHWRATHHGWRWGPGHWRHV
jgi:WXXGXW repeat (2 copies)